MYEEHEIAIPNFRPQQCVSRAGDVTIDARYAVPLVSMLGASVNASISAMKIDTLLFRLVLNIFVSVSVDS